MTLIKSGGAPGSTSSLDSNLSAEDANCVPIEDVSEHFSVLQSTRLNYTPPKPKILQGHCSCNAHFGVFHMHEEFPEL